MNANILTFSWNAVTIVLKLGVHACYKCEIDRLAIGTWMYIFKRVYQHVNTLPFTLSWSDNTIDSVPNGYDTYANF